MVGRSRGSYVEMFREWVNLRRTFGDCCTRDYSTLVDIGMMVLQFSGLFPSFFNADTPHMLSNPYLVDVNDNDPPENATRKLRLAWALQFLSG